jgi:Lon protease-like protein
MKDEPTFGVVLIKQGREVGGPAVPHTIGTTARIIGVERKAQDVLHITTVGEERFQIRQVLSDRPYLVGVVDPYPLEDVHSPEVGTLSDITLALFTVYLDLLSRANDVEITMQRVPDTPEALAYFVAVLLQVASGAKQQLLATADLPTVLSEEAALLRGQVDALKVLLRGEEILSRSDAFPELSMN